jgi:hypothetical protein
MICEDCEVPCRPTASLQRNIDAGPAGGMGREAEYIEHPDVAIDDLSEADRILQSQTLVAREPQMRRPFPPLRQRQAI